MKKYAFIALLLIAALTLAGCGGTTFADLNPEDYVTLGNYEGIKFQDRPTEATDFAVEAKINAALKELGYSTQTYNNTKEGGTVKLNDIININYKGMKDGVAFEGGTAENSELGIGTSAFIPGFEEQLVGVNVGETVKIPLTFPVQYQSAELAGQDVVFHVTVNSIVGVTNYPELTDKIAKEIDEDVKTVDELRKKMKEAVAEENKAELQALKENRIWGEVLEGAKFKKDLPKDLVESFVTALTKSYEAMAKQYGYDDLNAMLKESSISEADFKASLEAESTARAKNVMVAYAIAKAEGYTLSEEDFDARAKENAKQYGYSDPTTYINANGREQLENQFILDYAVELVIEKADIAAAK